MMVRPARHRPWQVAHLQGQARARCGAPLRVGDGPATGLGIPNASFRVGEFLPKREDRVLGTLHGQDAHATYYFQRVRRMVRLGCR